MVLAIFKNFFPYLIAILRGDFDKLNAPTIWKDILCFIR